MTITYFGSYEPYYPRNILTRRAFIKLGMKIIECNDRCSGLSHYLNLIAKFLKNAKDSDVIFIGVLGHYDVPLAWVLAKLFKKQLVFDAFYSVYEAYIEERKVVSRLSLQALRFWFYDFFSAMLADKIIMDTEENADFFSRRYSINRSKFYELPVTAFFSFKDAGKKELSRFTVGYYGSFLPLHGVDIIIDAVKQLNSTSIKCFLLGSGPGLDQAKQKVNKLKLNKKIIFLQNINYEKLPNFYKKISLFLAGPFGNTSKAKRVVPAKAVEALAVGAPVVVSKTPTCWRLLKQFRNDIYWLKKNNAHELSEVIMSFFRRSMKRGSGINFQNTPLGFNGFTRRLGKIIEGLK